MSSEADNDGKRSSSPAGGRGKASADGGVTIPGYQPVESLGTAPSYGAWVRAVQVRMDRRVLLKVLKPGLPRAHEYFSREIGAVVRLDGEGILRAIDEGTVRGFRYLVLDEAEGIPLTPAMMGEGDEGWVDLTRTALDLWRRILERNCVLLPLPAITWRRLPAGDFAASDLGWLVPFEQSLPQHPSLPADLIDTPASPRAAIAAFEATGAQLAEALSVPYPPAWRRAVTALSATPEDAQYEDVLRAFADAKLAVEPPKTPRTVLWATLALFLVVGMVWGTVHVMTRPDVVPNPNQAGEPKGTAPEVGETTPEPPTEDPEKERRRLAEESGWAAIEPWVPDRPEESDEPLPDYALLSPEAVAGFQGVIAAHPGTAAAQLARTELEVHRWASEDSVRAEFAEAMEQISAAVSEGRLADAEGLTRAAQAALGRSGREELRSEFDALLRTRQVHLDRLGTASFDRLAESIGTAIRERRFRAGATDVARAIPGLLPRDQEWAEEQRLALLATGTRFDRVRRTVEQKIVEGMDRAEAVDFPGAIGLLAPVEGEDEFHELQARRNEWRSHLQRADGLLAELREQVSAEKRRTKTHPYEFRDGTSVRGRVIEVDAQGFRLKEQGLRKERVVPWIELATEEWQKLGADGMTVELRLLTLTLLGDEKALRQATRLDPVPAWTIDAQRRKDRAANADLDRWLAEGRSAYSAGAGQKARAAAMRIAEQIPADLWQVEQQELESWCRAHWQLTGPANAFPGSEMTWREDRSITLRFDFSQAGATRSWAPARAGARVTKAGDSMAVTGSIWLAPGGHPDLFAGDLSVETSFAATDRRAPNLNLILGSHRAGDAWRGDFFGFGFKPPPPNAARIEDEVPIFLPANLCGPVEAVEEGIGRELFWVDDKPKISTGRAITVSARVTASEVALQWRGQKDLNWPRTKGDAPRGTVEFRSYRSQILIRDVEVSGTVSLSWWERWLSERVALDLDGKRD